MTTIDRSVWLVYFHTERLQSKFGPVDNYTDGLSLEGSGKYFCVAGKHFRWKGCNKNLVQWWYRWSFPGR